jgi:hypothetical protein
VVLLTVTTCATSFEGSLPLFLADPGSIGDLVILSSDWNGVRIFGIDFLTSIFVRLLLVLALSRSPTFYLSIFPVPSALFTSDFLPVADSDRPAYTPVTLSFNGSLTAHWPSRPNEVGRFGADIPHRCPSMDRHYTV